MTTDLNSSPLSGDQQARLADLLTGMNEGQLFWLAGFLAGKCSGGSASALANTAANATGVAAPAAVELTILFGSQTGNAEELAQQLAARAADKGVSAKVVDMADYKPKQLKKEQYLAVLTSTHGEGDPPDSALDFHEFLNGKKAPKLEGLRYSVLSLGDSSYEHFCKTGQDFDGRLATLGATALAERVDCDVDYEDLAEDWINRVLETIASEAGASQPAAATTVGAEQAPASAFNRKNPYAAVILTNQLLSGRGSDKEVRHIELSLEDSGLSYNPGDALGVYPENSPALVDELLGTLTFDGKQVVSADELEIPLREALAFYREITLLTPPLMKHWAELVDDDALKALVADSSELRVWAEGRDVLDLVRAWPAAQLQPQEFVNLLRKLPPRLYSISSSQASVEDEVHITVAAVRYSSHDRDREGVASGWLSDRMGEGDEVRAYIDPNKKFALPEDSAPVIMIGPGTGVAPFRAFLQEREERGAEGDNWLFFGDRRFRSDFLYQSEWLKWRREGLLTRLDVAFSRDQAEKRYVQHSLKENGADVWAWLQRGASLYVCGDADKMAPDVHQALLDIASEQGGLSQEQAEDYLRQLNRDKRYLRDVY
ncbi:sulfite reductase (NADPH) flavoprotein alpha-component [Marinobacter sp. LV10R510-11A]|uniref:assimilatory sulfite reductase (NADPH) flavoprotein subunit n=1 Tax=Marinobacter sp. LV10R510-11A TaxID=1415568 RepID=UPI000BB92A97|nr:assimilatory sulfite reductase (NADPH) flavoprotein subunit [Marinobacter sp. LV10R510-11A]SOB74797.1 sulfite reductase (NADPH) flavoprotein alpha-component [Marinobacter sp. LV10R510-11A]